MRSRWIGAQPFLDHRGWTLIGVCLLVGALCGWSYVEGNRRAERQLSSAPVGSVVQGFFWAVVEVDTNVCIVEVRDHRFRLYGPVDGLRPGTLVSFRAIVASDGLRAQSVHIHRWNRTRIAVSLPPLVIIVFLLMSRYRINARRLLIERRAVKKQ